MTTVAELHNMSVPPRTVLTVARQVTPGRRFRIDLAGPLAARGETVTSRTLRLREKGAACLLELLDAADATADPLVHLKALCDEGLAALRLPGGFGFFVQEESRTGDALVSPAAAIAILAARSGPLYLPGRFEPSLIALEPVTLLFPAIRALPREGRAS
jgi:hypothetical protein